MKNKNKNRVIKNNKINLLLIFKSKNANAVALVLLALIGLSATALYAKHTYDGSSLNKGMQGQITTEVDLAVQRAVYQGINDFLTNGFSKNNDVWFCNYPFPVNVTEADISLHYFINERLNAYLDELRKQGYDISEPKISFPGVNSDLSSLDNNSITVKVDNLIVGVKTDELEQKQDLSNQYVVNWPVWFMYKNINSWMKEDGGGISNNIYNDVFYDKPCQMIKSCCNCSEDKMISQGLRDEIKLKLEDIYPAINKSIYNLTKRFEGTKIICNYSIEKYHIENIEKFNYSEAQTSYLNCTTDLIPWNTSNYNYKYTMWSDDFTLPGPGLDELNELGGCPTWESGINATKRPHIEINTSLFKTEYESEKSEQCTYSTLAFRMHNEEFALDKKLGLLIKVNCIDPDLMIENEKGVEPLKSEVSIRVSVRMDCPTPTKENVDDKEAIVNGVPTTFACPGGSGGGCCFPAGTEINMADGSKKPIEEVNIGDWINSYDKFSKSVVIAQVLELEKPIREGLYTITFDNGKTLVITNDHPLYTKKTNGYLGWAAIDKIAAKKWHTGNIEEIENLESGDEVLQDNMQWAKVLSFTYEKKDVQTYNLKQVSDYNNFFADGFLAHNKIYGYIGPLCIEDIKCPTCQGCIVVNGKPTCLIAPETECPGVCTVCDESGGCTKAAPRGTPCTNLGDCMMCDGASAGAAGCTLFDPPEARAFNLDCSIECKKCAGDGSGCTANLDKIGEMDDCPECQTCGTEGQCITTDIGKKCSNCKSCSANGLCEDISIGRDDCGNVCERCLPTGQCGIDLSVLSLPGINGDCGSCKKCGLLGCEADSTKENYSCSSCKVCKDGSCSKSKPNGTVCGGGNGCNKGCINGNCNMGLNIGAVCGSNYECASALCNSIGDCALQTSMTGKQCCGDKLCNAGDPCCPYGGWKCNACDDTTT